MAELKTSPTDGDVGAFIDQIDNPIRQRDAKRVCELLTDISGEQPAMWGPSIVGFGTQHLVYESGRELDWMRIGFSPRKAQLTIYINDGFDPYTELLDRLGKHKTAKSCLYVKNLDDIDIAVLTELLALSFAANAATAG